MSIYTNFLATFLKRRFSYICVSIPTSWKRPPPSGRQTMTSTRGSQPAGLSKTKTAKSGDECCYTLRAWVFRPISGLVYLIARIALVVINFVLLVTHITYIWLAGSWQKTSPQNTTLTTVLTYFYSMVKWLSHIEVTRNVHRYSPHCLWVNIRAPPLSFFFIECKLLRVTWSL